MSLSSIAGFFLFTMDFVLLYLIFVLYGESVSGSKSSLVMVFR